MKWFRFYSEVLHDPKVQKLSPEMFRHWVNVLCIANDNDPRGTLPDVATVAFALRIKPSKADEILRKLVYAGLLDGEDMDHLAAHNWENRQRKSDNVAARVADHRSHRVRSASAGRPGADAPETSSEPGADGNDAQTREIVTLQDSYSNALDTDTEKEEIHPPLPPKGGVDYPADFETFWKAYPNKKAKGYALKAWERIKARPSPAELVAAIERARASKDWKKDNGAYIPHPATWLNGRCWEDEMEPAAPVRAQQDTRTLWLNTQRAEIESKRQWIEEHPNSPHIPAAREKIRELEAKIQCAH
jgi:hypothetical protein